MVERTIQAVRDAHLAVDDLSVCWPCAGFSSAFSDAPRDREKGMEPRVNTRGLHMPKIEFVRIPAGEYFMGSDRGDVDERPSHLVKITEAFEMSKCEVTQAQWYAIMGGSPSHFKGSGRPVESVSWDDAQKFVRKLNAIRDGYRYRLPTEAEWEYAARAGAKEDSPSDPGAVAWYGVNAENQTHRTGLKGANAWGLNDMLGNVAEWCQDSYERGYYSHSPETDPRGPASGQNRAIRGGSYVTAPGSLRVTVRLWAPSRLKGLAVGFRLVRRMRPLGFGEALADASKLGNGGFAEHSCLPDSTEISRARQETALDTTNWATGPFAAIGASGVRPVGQRHAGVLVLSEVE